MNDITYYVLFFNDPHSVMTKQILGNLYETIKEMEIDTIQKLISSVCKCSPYNPNKLFYSLFIIMATHINPIFEKITLGEFQHSDVQMFKNTHRDHVMEAFDILNNICPLFFSTCKCAHDFMSVFFDIEYIHGVSNGGFRNAPSIGKNVWVLHSVIKVMCTLNILSKYTNILCIILQMFICTMIMWKFIKK